MRGYNSTSLALAAEPTGEDCFAVVEEYLSAENGYWQDHDVWMVGSGKFEERGIDLEGRKRGSVADFTAIPSERLKMELKYHALWSLTTRKLSVSTYAANYKSATGDLGRLLRSRRNVGSITEISLSAEELAFEGMTVFPEL